jgi:hypothetical protein
MPINLGVSASPTAFRKPLEALGQSPPFVTFVRMYYDDKVPGVRQANDEPSHLAKMVLPYKNYKWIYEREWRMVASLGKAYYRNVACVTHVYLGSRIEHGKRQNVIRSMKHLKIKTDEMTISNAYSISYKRIASDS